ncbi:protein NRT1/ PTR FAMILY 1.2 [Canna indica]|uniref:Protein NRT1/ PTR FAMILY 1.2 n=1 Tax=Canna indica TaxID=4628 RepID=A0AAQ3KMV3_9LILI|nr:protein NRT1/ PTR FAMILY 1.2 [Canna indica]
MHTYSESTNSRKRSSSGNTQYIPRSCKLQGHSMVIIKGGVKAIPFIIANEVLEKVSCEGIISIMVIYLTKEYHLEAATAASVMFAYAGFSEFVPMFTAYLSDSYLGRFRTIAFASILSLMGAIIVWFTAMYPEAKPPTCELNSWRGCRSATAPQLILLFTALTLLGTGAAGLRPCSLAFGVDQFTQENTPQLSKVLQFYFSGYFASIGISLVLATTVIVYIIDTMGWKIGFGVTMAVMALSTLSFLLGSPLYIKLNEKRSIFSEFAQVIVTAIRNRKYNLSKERLVVVEYHRKSTNIIIPSDYLRFLNKACVIKNRDEELSIDGVASDPWRLCTVEQVEDLKSVIGLIPLWSTGIIISLVMNISFPVLQAETMDRHIGQNFQFPAASIGVFMFLTFTLGYNFYNHLIVPLLVKITGKPIELTLKQRMGIGLLLGVLGTGVATVVEAMRRRMAIKEGLPGEAAPVVSMSVMWLVLQTVIVGLAQAFNVNATVEFFYNELPKSMNSFAMALWSLGLGVGSMLGTVLVKMIDEITSRDGRVSWLTSDLNKGHYEYYYLILTLMGAVNFFYFLVCCWAHGKVKKKPWEIEEEVLKEKP